MQRKKSNYLSSQMRRSYRQKTLRSHKKTLGQINLAKLEETKKAQSLFVFLYLTNEQSEKETKKQIPFISIKKNKILRNKFNKDDASLLH